MLRLRPFPDDLNPVISKPVLNAEQKEAFKALRKFLEHPGPDTFVLKGYAGSGKTFLMQYLAGWLKEQNKTVCLLASTGRAASVLKGKTGISAKTVHGELYQFNNVEGDHDHLDENAPEEAFGQMRLQFVLRKPDEAKRIYIVDEASMLSSEPAEESVAAFGSGLLMNDFFDGSGSNKIILVGDPCQLPPVGQAFSPALDMEWLASQRRTAISVTLETIERTKADNDILAVANRIRELILYPREEKWPKIPAAGRQNVRLFRSAEMLFQEYLNRYKQLGPNGTLAIARSNATVKMLNAKFRSAFYGSDDMPLQTGDVLLVNRNNFKVGLTNGDFVLVTGLGAIVSKAGLNFQSVKIKALAADKDYEILVSLDVLYGENNQFNQDQNKSLMIDFTRRAKNRNLKMGSPLFKEAMQEDDYLNCLQATYGYAVTCHKAQGGEWNDVFLFLDKGMYGMPRQEMFRWWYTAVTRAKRELNLENGWWIE